MGKNIPFSTTKSTNKVVRKKSNHRYVRASGENNKTVLKNTEDLIKWKDSKFKNETCTIIKMSILLQLIKTVQFQ